MLHLVEGLVLSDFDDDAIGFQDSFHALGPVKGAGVAQGFEFLGIVIGEVGFGFEFHLVRLVG